MIDHRHALVVQKRLKDHYIPEITSIQYDGEFVEPPQPVKWYPDELAWSMNTPKNVVRRFKPFASFQKFLVSETSIGNISRQEVVSMIPPLLMDVKPWMTVLDLCAAPGSKAAQLTEMIHGGEEARTRKLIHKLADQNGREVSPDGMELDLDMQDQSDADSLEDDGRSTGLIVANDADWKRAHMLVHQLQRLNSPNLIVTNHDARHFPSIKIPSDPPAPGQRPRTKYLKFDRILADVPCSGDGTVRKNPNVWKDWTPANGLGLHVTQVSILVRAIQMLKNGGRVVYSTCSMNPVENEAVVAGAIDRCGGMAKVHILDCSDALPGLKRKPGLKKWTIMDKQSRIWSSWEEVQEREKEEQLEGIERLSQSMFPSATTDALPLERCMRVYPHLQNTGGFFITVLEKQSEIGKAKPESENKKIEEPTSLMNVVNELERKPSNGNDLEKIDALDDIPQPEHEHEEGTVPPAARQNQENAPQDNVISASKRKADEEADAEMSTKRPKFREVVPDPAPEGMEQRLEHFPPPPGADLDISQPAERAGPISTLPPTQKKKNGQPTEEPFKYLEPDHPELQHIYKFYNLSSRFPRDRFMVRNAMGLPTKKIYYTTSQCRDILTENEGNGIKFVHSGLKMFVKQDVQKQEACPWRIQTESIPILDPWIGEERVLRLQKRSTLRKLLIEMFPRVGGDDWKELGEVGEQGKNISMGCAILRVQCSDDPDGFK